MRNLFYPFAFLLIILACSTNTQNNEDKPSRLQAKNSHMFMVKLLDSLDQAAIPRLNYHMNRQRAKRYRQIAENAQNQSQKVNALAQYAIEMINAAQVDTAINVLQYIINRVSLLEDTITPNLKPIYDYLAIAYLRKGELDNCVVNHNSASCIIPLQEKAFHQDRTGSENAVDIYKKILRFFPDDQNAKYLLNVAYMTLGAYPEEVPKAYKIPLDVFKAPSQFSSWENIAISLGVDMNGIAGGSVAEDFDQDGRIDLLASSYDYGDQVRLFKNLGAQGFHDYTKQTNLQGISGGLNMIATDYNNDAYPDVLILRGGWLGNGGRLPNSLLKNNGDGTFTDVTRESGILSFNPTQTAAWADFNNDGWLDLFIGNESGQFLTTNNANQITAQDVKNPCELYINQKDGTFKNAASEWNVDFTGFIKGVVAADFNNDGWQDLYVSALNQPNKLLMNQGGVGFEDRAVQIQVVEPIESFPVVAADFNNDGWEDIFVSGYDLKQMQNTPSAYLQDISNESELISAPKLYINNQKGGFDDVTQPLGLYHSIFGMGINVGDLNNDGYEDLYIGTGTPNLSSIVPNRMFLNTGKSGFLEISHTGFAHIQKGHGISFADLNNDGDQDIYAVMGGAFEGDYAQNVLFENPNTDSNSWVILQPYGKSSNRMAVGSKIHIQVKDNDGNSRSIYRTVGTGGSFGSNSLQIELGLGKAESIELIEVEWAGTDIKDEFHEVPINCIIKLHEGGQLEKVERNTIDWKQLKNKLHHHHH